MKIVPWVVCGLMLIVAGLTSWHCDRTPSPGKGILELSFDHETGELTLRSNEASLFEILNQLDQQHQIEVIVPNLLEDQKVTVAIKQTPLASALAQFLPANSRFHFRIRELDTVISGQEGTKKRGQDYKPKPDDLPIKDQAPPLPDDQRTKMKVPPEESNPGDIKPGRPGFKSEPKDSLTTPGQGPKQPRVLAPSDSAYARLNVYMQQDSVVLVKFLEVTGEFTSSTTVDGTLIHATIIDNQVIAVGSQQDPLGVRSYLEDNTGHSARRVKDAYFTISLPSALLDRERLGKMVIKFYLLSETGDYPQELTPQTFQRFDNYLKPIGEIRGGELLKAYDNRNR